MITAQAKLLDRIQQFLTAVYLRFYRSRLNTSSFSIISSNCWGGIFYKDFGLPYETPFVNMFMHAPCFMRMLGDLPKYLERNLRVVNVSRYFDQATKYPVGLLDDVEIHFIHYTFEDDVLSKWNERKKRLRLDNLLLVLSERDACSPEHIRQFQTLPFPNKICFTVNKYGGPNIVRFPWLLGYREVLPADQLAGFSYWRTDIISFLNNAFPKDRNPAH